MKIKNPTGGPPRGHDAYGSGAFLAPRDGGVRLHKGLDLVSTVGQMIRSPIRGTIVREKRPYGDGSECDHGILIEGAGEHQGLTCTLFYIRVAPSLVGTLVNANAIIGTACSLERRYPGITNHVHLELTAGSPERLDPLPLIFCGMPYSDREALA